MRKIARVRILLEYEDGGEQTFLEARAPNIQGVEWEREVITEEIPGSLVPRKKPGRNVTATVKITV